MSDKWTRYLRDALGEPVRPTAPAPMPKYANSGTLRGRGGIDGVPLNRAYDAHPVLPPITPERAMLRAGLVQQALDNYRAGQLLPTPTPHSPAMDQAAFLDQVYGPLGGPPGGSSPSVPHGGPLPTVKPEGGTMQIDDPAIVNWLALPLPVKYETPPPMYTAEQWAQQSQEQKDAVIKMLAAGPATGPGDVVDDVVEMRDDAVNTVKNSVVGDILGYDLTSDLDKIPVVGGVLDSIAHAGPKLDDARDWWTAITAPIGIVDRWIDAAENVIRNTDVQDIKDVPGDLVDYGKDYVTGVKDAGGQLIDDPSIDTALNLGGQAIKPVFDAWDAALGEVKQATGEQMYQVALGRGAPKSGQPDPMLQWVIDHPEEWENIQDVYLHGYDFNQDGHTDWTGERAVWEYVIGKFDPVTRTLVDAGYDPMSTLIPGLGRTGKAIRTAEDASLGARIAGRALEAPNLPNAVGDAAVEKAVAGVGKTVGRVPGVKRLSDYLTGPDSRTAYRRGMEEVGDLTETGVAGVDEVNETVSRREAERVATVRTDADVRRQGYAVPGDEVVPETSAASQPFTAEQAVRPARSAPKTKGWSVVPSEERYAASVARGETPHITDWAAHEVPEVWDEIAGSPTLARQVERLEPRLTKGSGGYRSKIDEVISEAELAATVKNELVARGVQNVPGFRLPADAFKRSNNRAKATLLARYLGGEDVPNLEFLKDPEIAAQRERIDRIRARFQRDDVIQQRVRAKRSEAGLEPVFSAADQAAARDAIPYRERAVKNPYIREAMRAADNLPPDAEQRVAAGVREWADTAYANYDGKTAFERTVTDLEYGGRLRASVYAEGGEIPDFNSMPEELFGPENFLKQNGEPDHDSMFVAVVMEPEFGKTKRLRTEMYQSGYLNQNPPRLIEPGKKITKIQYASTDIPAYVAHEQAYERYLQMYHLRHQLHADPEDVLKGVDWMPGMEAVPEDVFTAPYKPIKGPRPDKITEQVYFVEDAGGQRVRREDGQLWWAHQKQDAAAYAKRLTEGEEAVPAQFQRKATPDVDPAAVEAESPMRTFANEVEHGARLDQEIADSSRTLDDLADRTQASFDEAQRTAESFSRNVDRASGRKPSQVARAKAKTRGPKPGSKGVIPPSEYRRIFEANFERAMKASGPLSPDADVFLSEMAAHGILTDEVEQGLKQVIGEGDKQTTVIDVILKHYADAANFDEATMTVDRALVKRKAQAEIARLKGIEPPRSRNLIDALWNGLDTLTQLAKSALIANPFTGPMLGARDMAGNAYSMGVLNGRWDVVNKARDPKAIKGFMLHNLNGGELNVPGLDVVNGWGIKPGRNVVDIQVKDIGGDIQDRNIWERFLGGDRGVAEGERSWKRFTTMGKFGRIMSNAIVAKPVLAWRHTGDQVFRWSYFSTLVDEGMTAERHAFYDAIRQAMPNDADRIIAELDGMRTFTRKDVFDLTKNKELSKDWLQRTTKVKQYADGEVNRVYFSYDQTRLDAALRRTVMFHYWLSRHSIFHAKAVLGNPALIYRYHQAWDAMDRWAEQNGASNPLKYYVSYQAKSGWFESIMNPVGILVPYVMFADLGGDRREGESTLDYINRTMGVFIAPHIQAAALILGKSKQYPDMLGLGSVFGNLTNLHNWARNQGLDIPGFREGVTPNVVKSVNDRIINLANEAAQWVTSGAVDDVALPDQVEQNNGVIMDILLDQALTEYGVESYYDLPTAVQKEVDAGILAIETGTSGNERAANAYKAWGDMRGAYQLNRSLNPIPAYTRSTGRAERTQANAEGFDALDAGSVPTADQQAAMDNSRYLGDSPEARSLNNQYTEYQDIGTTEQQGWANARKEILYGGEGEIPDNYTITVKGKTFTFAQVREMTDEQRRYLADQWLAEQGPEAVKAMEDYDAERKKFREAHPEVGDFVSWQSDAFKVGSAREFRTQVARMNPNFRRAMEAKRDQLIGRGLSGDELEAELDDWAVGTDGYLAFNGVKANRTDKDPIAVNDPTAVPVMPGQGGIVSGSSGNTITSGYNEERGMPQWQVDDEAEILAYYDDVNKLLQAAGVSDLNALNPTAQRFVLKDLPEKPRSVSSYEAWVEKQKPGADTSLPAYWASKNADYEKKKNKEVETSLGI